MLRDPNVSRRHAELRRSATGDWTIVDLGSTNGVKVNGRRVASEPAQPRRPGDRRLDDLHRSTSSSEPTPTAVDYDPISVALKFGFLVVLYLFLLWIARSALKDLRRTVAPAPDATGFHQAPAFSRRRAAAATPG